MKSPALILAALLALVLAVPAASAATREEVTLQNATLVLREVQAMPDLQIPDWLLARAEGIVVLPSVIKFGLGVGMRIGNGVMVVRTRRGTWSNPVFVNIGAGSFGWQAGGQAADVVLVFTTRQSIEGITDGKLTLGADASVAAGPVGRTAMASTSVGFDAEVYAYSRTRGLFAGVSLEGSGIFISHRSNRRFYDEPRITASDILLGDIAAPAPAAELMSEVRRLTSAASERVTTPAAADVAPPPPTPVQPPAPQAVETRTFPMADPEPGREPR